MGEAAVACGATQRWATRPVGFGKRKPGPPMAWLPGFPLASGLSEPAKPGKPVSLPTRSGRLVGGNVGKRNGHSAGRKPAGLCGPNGGAVQEKGSAALVGRQQRKRGSTSPGQTSPLRPNATAGRGQLPGSGTNIVGGGYYANFCRRISSLFFLTRLQASGSTFLVNYFLVASGLQPLI